MLKLKVIFLFALVVVLSSCMNDDWGDNVVYPESQTGVFIINSGNFQTGTAALSYYDIDSNVVYNDILSNANGLTTWGDVAQSMVVRNGLGYVVINNSGKILVIDVDTYKVVGKITGLTSPRHIHFVSDDKAYVTDLYARAINVVNPEAIFTSEQREATPYAVIDVNNGGLFDQHSTEKMVQWGHYVFVACWMRDNQILVLDSNTDEVVDSITVGAQPNSLVIDKYNKLWVLNDGGYDGNPYAYEAPQLTRINLNSFTVEDSYVFPLDGSPSELVINANLDTLYFLNSDVYKHGVLSQEMPAAFISGNAEYSGYGRGFYSLIVDPSTSDIYVSDAIDNAQSGYVYRFLQDATPLDTFKVGVNPVGFCFK